MGQAQEEPFGGLDDEKIIHRLLVEEMEAAMPEGVKIPSISLTLLYQREIKPENVASMFQEANPDRDVFEINKAVYNGLRSWHEVARDHIRKLDAKKEYWSPKHIESIKKSP